ncbi:MAG: response regulator [Cellvibrionaceae bacterium]|nr:response regulator [Cellvibrionaceae bacterium]|tara:strand:+ start:28787 stop:30418 length:1632 start_codon:yes stop_codon:yes gene_type:complete
MRQIDAIKIYQRKRCLIVDDMNEVRGSLKRMLMTLGTQTADTAANSEQAIEACEKTSYDLVLCDYNLGPGQDGQQVLEELRYRKLLKNASMFLMITAETSRDMVLGALEYLPDDYLTKPITPAMLQTRLNRIVIRHEDLLPIKQAIDDNDYDRAIAECQAKLDSGGKYTGSYQRIQAELLFRQEDYDRAQTIYEESLKNSNPVWAQLGLGKTYLARQMFDEAEEQLQAVVEHDHRYVEAHDLLAEVFSQQADYQRSQQAMQAAAEVSPKSVLRQRRLANMAAQNKDQNTSLKARRSALKVGEHSCYYSPQDYFDIVSELLQEDETDAYEARDKKAKEANMYIKRAEKKHPEDKNIKLQATAANSRLAVYRRKNDEAASYLEKAKALQSEGGKDAYSQLELAQAMTANGDPESAANLIQSVAKQHSNNEDISDRADVLSEEPVSKKGRKIAADLTKKGIKLYESKKYDDSIEVFTRAIALFPNHTGLRLNIVQVSLAKTKDLGATPETKAMCQEHLASIADLNESSPQFARFQHLLNQVHKLGG